MGTPIEVAVVVIAFNLGFVAGAAWLSAWRQRPPRRQAPAAALGPVERC
ncbi:MAG TPA: hypothetical protein VF763_12130 [Candidatus Limnocylindrales bacterium]